MDHMLLSGPAYYVNYIVDNNRVEDKHEHFHGVSYEISALQRSTCFLYFIPQTQGRG